MPRKFFVGGNWKMNGDKKSIVELSQALNAGNADSNVEVVIGCPAVYIAHTREHLRKDWEVAGEYCYKKEKGAYTGEVSPQMLKDVGATWVILGHSERRDIFKESDDEVAEKCAYALASGLKIIPCIGEHLEERENGTTMEVCSRQLKAIAAKVSDWTDVVIAYEPVWAIGTGKTATPEQAQETHKQIREWIAQNVSAEVAAGVRILYGGSVSPSNAAELGKKEDIDGFLVGGAALTPTFLTIVNAKL